MANSSIKILRSGESGKSPESLEYGELALNYADGKLFYLNSANTIAFIKNSDSFSTINVNNQFVMAGSSSDILNLRGMNGIDISANNKTITFDLQTSDLINSNSAIAASANSVRIVNYNLTSHSVDYLSHNKIIEISSANGEVLMDTYSKNDYRTAEYNIQAKNGNDIHIGKAILSHNDIDLFFMEPWEMLSANTRLYTFDAIFNSNDVNVYLNSLAANTSFKISRTIIPA